MDFKIKNIRFYKMVTLEYVLSMIILRTYFVAYSIYNVCVYVCVCVCVRQNLNYV